MNLYNKLRDEFFQLPNCQKSSYAGAEDYIVKNGGPELKSLNKNYKLLIEETEKRLSSQNKPELYNIDTFSRNESIQDLLSSLENDEYIKRIYRSKKKHI